MKTTAIGLLVATFLTATLSPAQAFDPCEGVLIQDTISVDSPDAKLTKGEVFTGITQYRVVKKTGKAIFCAKGEYCYPASAFKLTTCKIGKRLEDDGEYIWYDIDLLRSKIDKKDLRRYDVQNQLLGIGMCTACASNASQEYLEHPRSACSRQVKSALEGNPAAIKTLTDGGSANACY